MRVELVKSGSDAGVTYGTLKLVVGGHVLAEVGVSVGFDDWTKLAMAVDAGNAEMDGWDKVVAMVPAETIAARTAEIVEHDGLQAGATVVLDEAELVAYRLRELNSIGSQLMDEANSRGQRLREWNAWGARLRATLDATPNVEDYSRRRVDSVMADCPLKVEG